MTICFLLEALHAKRTWFESCDVNLLSDRGISTWEDLATVFFKHIFMKFYANKIKFTCTYYNNRLKWIEEWCSLIFMDKSEELTNKVKFNYWYVGKQKFFQCKKKLKYSSIFWTQHYLAIPNNKMLLTIIQ